MNFNSTHFLHKAATVLTAAAMFASCQQLGPNKLSDADMARKQIAPNLFQLGARNWVIVADTAYPLPAGESVVCINVPCNLADTLREVLDLMESEGAVVPRLWVSHELSAVQEKRAPGIKAYRTELEKLLLGRFHYEVNSRVVDMQINKAAKDYRILVIRTSSRLPYSSIAIELDSGYWNSDAELEVRQRIEKLFPPLPPPAEEQHRQTTTTFEQLPGITA